MPHEKESLIKTKMRSIKGHFEQARLEKRAEDGRNTQLIHVYDLCVITVKPLPLANSTARISPASSNPSKWWGISTDHLHLGIKPAV